MHVDRARAVAVIRDIRESLIAERTGGIIGFLTEREGELIQRACEEHAITLADWIAVLRAEVDLGQLFEKALEELAGEPPDPGPYDVISREAPFATPEAGRSAFERDRRLLHVARQRARQAPDRLAK